MTDGLIKATADDAMAAKLATAQAGYYVDPFLNAFSRSFNDELHAPEDRSFMSSETGTCQTRNVHGRTVQPIIKRGTHARVCVINRAVSSFLKMQHDSPVIAGYQVVVLGAGKDTSYFRYRNGDLMGTGKKEDVPEKESIRQERRRTTQQIQMQTTSQYNVHWYEVDHISVIREKASLIKRSNLLKSLCPLLVKTEFGYECTCDSGGLNIISNDEQGSTSSSTYHLMGHDLRDSPTILLEKLNLNPTFPTLFIMECVSMYIPIADSICLLEALSVSSDEVFIACYEPILGSNSSKKGDPFGQVMERNLVTMGVASPESCLLQTRTLRQQLKKLVDCKGFIRAVGCDMWSAYATIVTEKQRERASRSEFMDEYEEWMLIMQHYCFMVAQGGRSLKQHRESVLTTVLDSTGDDKNPSNSIGWVSGKCLELEIVSK